MRFIDIKNNDIFFLQIERIVIVEYELEYLLFEGYCFDVIID